MSGGDKDSMSGGGKDNARGGTAEAPRENPPEEAVFRPSRWPGLIWAVPIAALAIIAWLGISALAENGPTVHVTFPITGGLKPGTTKVEYQGYVVGHVGNVALTKSLGMMKVDLNFDAPMGGHLGPGTRYWITGGSFSLNNLSAIKDVISGPVISVDPRPGKTVHKVQGLSQPPILKSPSKGLDVVLLAKRLGNVSAGSPVFYKGYKVGEVLGITLSPDGRQFHISAFIDAPWQKLVTTGTRFWDAGAVRLSTSGGPGLQIQSIPALLMGAVALETPAGMAGQPAPNGATFKLYDSEGQATNAPGAAAVPYMVTFPGGPRGLAAGAPVQLEGATVGGVTNVAMQYDAAKGALTTTVMLALQPQRVGLAAGQWNLHDPKPQMNAMMTRLVAQGLRAEMGSTIPVIGGKTIDLAMVKDAPAAKIEPGNPPQIPSFGGGGDIGRIMAQLDDILASVNAMPLDKIAENVHAATAQLSALAKAPQTKQTLRHFDETMTHVDRITQQADTQLPAILKGLRESAREAEAALQAAQGLLSSQGPANASPEAADLPQTLYQLSQAAHSLRVLADYLDSHPGALIAGRGD